MTDHVGVGAIVHIRGWDAGCYAGIVAEAIPPSEPDPRDPSPLDIGWLDLFVLIPPDDIDINVGNNGYITVPWPEHLVAGETYSAAYGPGSGDPMVSWHELGHCHEQDYLETAEIGPTRAEYLAVFFS